MKRLNFIGLAFGSALALLAPKKSKAALSPAGSAPNLNPNTRSPHPTTKTFVPTAKILFSTVTSPENDGTYATHLYWVGPLDGVAVADDWFRLAAVVPDSLVPDPVIEFVSSPPQELMRCKIREDIKPLFKDATFGCVYHLVPNEVGSNEECYDLGYGIYSPSNDTAQPCQKWCSCLHRVPDASASLYGLRVNLDRVAP